MIWTLCQEWKECHFDKDSGKYYLKAIHLKVLKK